MDIFTAPVIAFAMTFISILLLKPLAIKLGLVDMPGGRKQHQGHLPLIGGIAMAIGIIFSILTLPFSLSHYRCLLACMGLIVFTGLLDDLRELSPRSRLFVQILVGLLMAVWGGIKLSTLGAIITHTPILLGFFAIPITVLAVVGLINAVNMTDGTDGLAGSLAFVEFFFLACLAHQNQWIPAKEFLYLILSVILAFLCFNVPWRQKATIFMGDSGSMLLGLWLAWFCIDLSQSPTSQASPVTFLWITWVPLFDIISVIWRRVLSGFSPFRPDRGHLHHYLLQKGFSALQVTLLMSGMAIAGGSIGVAGAYFQVPQNILFLSFILSFIIYLVLIQGGWKKLAEEAR